LATDDSEVMSVIGSGGGRFHHAPTLAAEVVH
jgi:hypothetical protein